MSTFRANESRFERSGIRMHHAGAIELALKAVNDHKNGLPELMKNSSGAYHRIPGRSAFKHSVDDRIIVLLFRSPRGRRGAAVGCLDLAGMTPEDIRLFCNWFDPNAASRGDPSAELWGGHGNGAKSYMLKMFERSWFATVRDGRFTRMGWQPGSYDIGFIPSKAESGAVRAPASLHQLDEILGDTFGASLAALPKRAQRILRKRPCWTCFAGLGARNWAKPNKILGLLQRNPQAIRTIEYCSVYAMVDGRLAASERPLRLESIKPLPGGEKPFEVAVPRILPDPDGGDVDTTVGGTYEMGKLIMHTSSEAMRGALRHRHIIRCESSSKGVVGLYDVEGLAGGYAEHIYGELHLDALQEFETNFRAEPHDSPLTRAVRQWLRTQIVEYANRFYEQARDRYTDQERKELQDLNGDMNRFLRQFLEEMEEIIRKREREDITGPGRGALPEGEVTSITHNMGEGVNLCGENVSLYVRLEFFDSNGNRVRSVPVHWESSNTGVAYAQLGSIITGQAGQCQIWAVAENGVRSPPVNLEVIHIDKIEITPDTEEPLSVGKKRYLQYTVTSNGELHAGVKLDWHSTDDQFVKVGSNVGVVTATAAPGSAEVWASALGATSDRIRVSTVAGEVIIEEQRYPKILLSEIDEDPDAEKPKMLDPDAGTVVQDIADRRRNIYWVNMRSPIADQFYREEGELSYHSPEFRVYLAERYAEVVFRVPLRLGEKWEPGEVEELLRDRPTQYRKALAANFQAWLNGEWRPI